MDFRIVSEIRAIETIAQGRRIRQLAALRDRYGPGVWRKKKGIAIVSLPDGSLRRAELHWYEAHGIGKVAIKVKRWL